MGWLLVLFLLCASVPWEVSLTTEPPPPQEGDLLRLTQQSTWTSAKNEFHKINMGLGALGRVTVLQACADSTEQTKRSVLSKWTERGEATHLLLDIAFAQEEESSGQPGPLQVSLSFPGHTRLPESRKVLDLRASQPFPSTTQPAQIPQYLSNYTALPLGSLTHTGFQLSLSYSGKCVLVSSIRVYYRRCPQIVLALSSFFATVAGSGEVRGSCVHGAVEVAPPVRECSVEGVWGPQQGQCVCAPGHQPVMDSCQACGIGFYRSANQSEECLRCPPHSKTDREGSDKCDCVSGFSRLPTDPPNQGCTEPPSPPVNINANPYNDSVLILTWDPPLNWGGRLEMSYRVLCERQDGGQWKACNDTVYVLPTSNNLTSTSVNLTGVSPYQDYRLSVQARNDISNLQGASHSSTATVTIHRWRAPPVVTAVSITQNPIVMTHVTVSQPQKSLFLWITVGVLFGVLFLLAVVPIAVCMFQQQYSKLRSEQEVELVPINPGISYTRPQHTEVIPQGNTVQQAGGDSVLQLLQGLGERLANSLKEVLVERDQLTLGKELGKGEFGSVYEALFSQDGVNMKVAVKTMRVGFHIQEDLHEFLREAEIMKSFDHDNVVRLLGVTLQREQDSPVPVPLVILPYMKHGDLRRFLIATRYGDIPMFVPHQTLLRFMVDVAEGMNYLSSQGFLHRDVAARNCMLGDDLRVCVADFGLSRKIYDSNYYRQKEAIRVPIKWMAIESLSESIYTTKSDVWSFGVTMWEILSRGRTPYPGVHNYELLDLLLMGHRLKAPDDCDSKLFEVMCSCWERQPTQRPSFRELVDELKALLSELPALEACQEATYINQGLEAAAAADYVHPQVDSGENTKENVYLPAPVGATAAPPQDSLEDGYLKFIAASVV